ncbi:MAG: hypothetical protein JRE43_07100 [Deltaproteobacteria bacterium]|jgi:hypothetical protein|nr:hypothetical protein [Deltaproteobacteria bacterium]MBW2542784.1 hypothetical protein [Deltaproteobacteria bacterium]
MRRTLVVLVGIWAFAAPAVCLALCPPMPAAVEIGAGDAEPSAPACHQSAPIHGDTQDSQPASAPQPNGDCCAEQQLHTTQASGPESPRAPLASAVGATAEIADAVAPTIVSTLRLEVRRVCKPHQQSNPPLLI